MEEKKHAVVYDFVRKSAAARKVGMVSVWFFVIGVAGLVGSVGMRGVQNIAPSAAYDSRVSNHSGFVEVAIFGVFAIAAGIVIQMISRFIAPKLLDGGNKP